MEQHPHPRRERRAVGNDAVSALEAQVKYRLIRIADWIDDKIICHRLYGRNGGLCHFLATSSWWGEKNPVPASSLDVWRRSRR